MLSASLRCYERSTLWRRFSRAPLIHVLTRVFSCVHCSTCCFLARHCPWSAGCFASTTIPLRTMGVEIVGSRAVVVALSCDVALPLMVSALGEGWSEAAIVLRGGALSAALGVVPRGQRASLDGDTFALID